MCSDTDSWTLDNYAATPTGKALTGTNCVDTSATVTDTTADYIVIEGNIISYYINQLLISIIIIFLSKAHHLLVDLVV